MDDPDRIPDDEQLRAIATQAARYVEVTRRLLRKYPDGRAPRGATAARDVAIGRLKEALARGESSAPYGWPETVCEGLEGLNDLAGSLESWSFPSVSLDDWHDDQFDVSEEEGILARLDELVATIPRTQGTPPPTKGTSGKRRGGRVARELTEMERRVWQLYQEHRDDEEPLYTVAELTGVAHKEVDRIVRMCKARRRAHPEGEGRHEFPL
jgi:hypothetical protein